MLIENSWQHAKQLFAIIPYKQLAIKNLLSSVLLLTNVGLFFLFVNYVISERKLAGL